MAPRLHIDTRDPRPIWRQIEEGIVELVGAGVLEQSAPLPSVRDLARELRINPNTVAKAYQRLVEQGLVETRRGEGTFVAAAPPSLTAADRRERLIGAATRLACVAGTLGANEEEVHVALDEALRRLARGSKEKR